MFDDFFDVGLSKLLNKNSFTGDLRHHEAKMMSLLCVALIAEHHIETSFNETYPESQSKLIS